MPAFMAPKPCLVRNMATSYQGMARETSHLRCCHGAARGAVDGREWPRARARLTVMGSRLANGIFCFTLLGFLGCATGGAPATPGAHRAPKPAPRAAAVLGPKGSERGHYRIRHGLVGDVGEVELRLSQLPSANNQALWLGEGNAFGSFLGIGESSTFRSQFDAVTGLSTTWSLKRDTGSATISDESVQASPGVVQTHRIHSKKPEDWSTLNAGAGTIDPFGLLMRLRTRPPVSGPDELMVLDGRALWKVTVSPGQATTVMVGGQSIAALRYALRSDPLDWQRAPSKTRVTQKLVVWLTNTVTRTPLALEAQTSLGNIRIEVVGTVASSVASLPPAGG